MEVAERVQEEIARINQDIPQIKIHSIIDTSSYIKNAISNVADSLLYGGVFAVCVLLFFLRNVRSTLVVAAAIPISIIATFMLIYFGGFTLNIMTLGGLALGVGMLVDNAIVVLENIYRLRETGMPPRQAAIQGASEVTGAIVASTLTTLVVFLPMIFIRGMSGIMFKQLAYVVSFSLLCSLGVALTLVPMLASRIITAVEGVRQGHKRLASVQAAGVPAGAFLHRHGQQLQTLAARLSGAALADHCSGPGATRRQRGPDTAHRRGNDAGDRRRRGPG